MRWNGGTTTTVIGSDGINILIERNVMSAGWLVRVWEFDEVISLREYGM